MNIKKLPPVTTSGFCPECGCTHTIYAEKAIPFCNELMDILDNEKRVDFESNTPCGKFTTDYLFGEARGQMFAVMVYRDEQGLEKTARAFSGQYNGHWEVPGWVPPIINPDVFHELTFSTERRIKAIGREMERHPRSSDSFNALSQKRKTLSRTLMKEIHKAYNLKNFTGKTSAMPDVVSGTKGIPTGTGDCCAPKLLNFAACNGYTPISIAEFFYGQTNRSGCKLHKHFYSSCSNKCGLILGFMLCGLITPKQ